MFSKKATKFDEIFTVNLTVKILSIFMAFLENMNFNNQNMMEIPSGWTVLNLVLLTLFSLIKEGQQYQI